MSQFIGKEPIQQVVHEVDQAHGLLHWLIDVFGPWVVLGFAALGIWVVWEKKLKGFIK